MHVRDIVDYFRGREEVSSLYVFGIRKGFISPDRELGVGVLIDERKCDGGRSDLLEMGAWDLTEDFPQWEANVVLLNKAPSFLKYHVVRKGSVVFERPPLSCRLRFTQHAVNQYLDQSPADAFRTGEMEEIGLEILDSIEG